jgi:hypothetical protein
MHSDLAPTHSERVTMELLLEAESTLSAALNGLGDHLAQRMEDMYYFQAAKHIHDTVDAFILLRKAYRVDGARLVVRPALETMLKLEAVRSKPELLYRALITDSKELDRWFSSVAKRHDVAYTPIAERREWKDFRARCVERFGAGNVETDTPLSAYDAAKAIKIEHYYDFHYRAFSHYVHGLLEAIGGGLDELLDPEASRVVLQSAIIALNALNHIGAKIPNLESLNTRASEILGKEPDKLLRRQKQDSPTSEHRDQ